MAVLGYLTSRTRGVRALDLLIGGLVLVVLATIVGTAGAGGGADGAAPTVPVQRGTVLSTVSADGNIEPPHELSLGFERSGRVTAVPVREGQPVQRGQVLARVEGTSERTALRSAQSTLAAARARLRDTSGGLSLVEVAENQRLARQAEVAVGNAENELANARNVSRRDVVALRRAVQRAQVSGEEADLRASELRLNQERAEVARHQARYDELRDGSERERERFEDRRGELAHAQSGRDEDEVNDLEGEVDVQRERLESARSDESNARSDLETARANVRSYVSDVESDRSALRDARRQLGDARDDLDTGIAEAQEQTDAARRVVADSRADLDVTLAQNRVEAQVKTADVAEDEADVAQAGSSLQDARERLAATVLRAPVDGVVGKVNVEEGELVGAGGSLDDGLAGGSGSDEAEGDSAGGSQPGGDAVSSTAGDGGTVIELSQVEGLMVEADFNETDAARLSPGDIARVSVDALPERELRARVVTIDPVDTVIDEVVTYEVTLVLQGAVTGLRPGMSATADVITDEADGALTLPKSAVSAPAGANPSVTVVHPDGRREERLVVVGLEGDGTLEVVGGVGQGQRVLRKPGSTNEQGS